ncbi:hypothetical protein H9Q70_010543 [Fusarium xylarioides]|nr:hypothetical protein H9Q70_010543 [Fusarium xylarioides]KAG5777676.1 hypothetical protein H9Q73_008673 [Fusarium xylarioides]
MEHAGEIDTDLENGNAVIAEEDPDFEEAEEEEDEEEYLDAMDAPDIELLEIKSDETSTVDHRSLILSLNTEWWERQRDFKVKLQTRGLTCRGPGLGSRLIITEPCPGQVTIDLDTALLRRPGGLRSAHMLSLQGRCIECNAARKAKILLKVLDTPVFRSRNIDFAPLGKRLDISIRDKWSCPDNYKEMVLERIEEIKNKERPGTDLVVLDDEFSLLFDRQLWEFSIIERVSGKVLIDTLVKHDRQAKQSSLWNKPVFKNLRAMNERHRQSVYSRRGRLQKLDVHEIAKRLKETGITPDSIVLMWHLYQFDLQLLRNFLPVFLFLSLSSS